MKIARWITKKTTNVDIETGEQITDKERDENYIIIKKTKHVTINELKTIGTIEYTNQCRRRARQGRLF